MATPKAKEEEVAGEAKGSKLVACGAPNAHYFKPGLNAEKIAEHGKLTCELPKGHLGDHFAKVDAEGNAVSNGFWSIAATVPV